ncbi:putative BRCA2 repeat-containing protein [Leptomonas pyrrhocoris]|uniref:Putative BRCA2 repeat-containing protein n=1 Tax=Leptomonas pyrrhocoris TaxID=157538 RepID=A0A0M9FSZ3_LEPPY|nr:putative BRCA2 repeat-containing protein [Leptomonas pyrrhocoris]KPA75425.1 putative BRCA2 repeat-containing protein [Leptomonas pyrrhocoris]|eukprot:XP_015653864.1 putative BRCA2 repeat-containing protein [Leptomonas pyrrhocoris]
MKGVACPHCTFINPPSRIKCGMCLRLLRKRERSANTNDTKKAKKIPDKAKNVSSPSAASSSPAESTQQSDVGPSQRQKETTGEGDGESHEATAVMTQEERQQLDDPPLHPSDATQSTNGAPADPAPPSFPSLLPPPASAVPTLFFTASGKAVTVRRESLQKAAERLESTSFSPPPASEPLVATLFETASGKRVTVHKDSIEKARQSFESADKAEAQSLHTISTLFETAAGTAVRVSEASLRRAREKLEDGERGASEDCTASLKASAGDTATADETETPSDNSVPSVNRRSSPLLGLSAGRRRGFVPPQQRLGPDPTARPREMVAPSSASAAVLPPSTRLEPLRFTCRSCACPTISPAPSLAAIMSEEFCFSAEECGPTLSLLLGVRETQSARVPQWHAGMLKLGASGRHCTVDWCRHALLSAMFRVSCASRSAPAATNVFSAESVLLCLLQAYNTEMVDGERPSLRRMVEGDMPSASLVVLYLSSIREERGTPHTRLVTLSDGIYHMKVTCDVPLSNLLREGVLRPGQKLAVCGAKSLLHGQYSPTECDTQSVLAINYNCVRAVSPQVPLGVCHGEPPPLPLSLVHPLGGLVPAIEGVVARVLPPFYMTQVNQSVAAAEDGGRPARERAIRAVRSSHAQLHVTDRLHRTMEGVESAAETRQLSRITSLLIVKDGTEALVQQWETVEERSLLTEDDEGLSLPMEGSWVTLYAVNPAKSRTAAAPFPHAKLFFSARTLHFVPSKRPLQHLRQVWATTAGKSTAVSVGCAADVCGLFVGHHKNEQGSFVLLLLQDSTYAVLQIPVPSVGRELSFPIPTTERTPLLLLNTTFLTTEDSVAGSDCCRLFASEYTVVVQRSTQSNLKEAMERAASLQAAVEAAPQKYAARKAEIFRCLDEGEAGAGGGTASCAPRSSYVSTEVPQDGGFSETVGSPTTGAGSIDGGDRSGFPSAASVLSKEGRLPYYLRQGNGNGGRRLHGVFIPSAPHASTTATPMSAAPAVASTTPSARVVTAGGGGPSSSRHYGNISDFMFVYDPRLNRRAWHPLEDPLPADPTASLPLPSSSTRQRDDFRYVQLCWSVSADSADDLTSRVEERRTLNNLMEAVCPLHELCSLIADERHIDVSLQRSERIARWRKESHEDVWWRLFAESRLLTSASELSGGAEAFLWWLPGEWEEATRTISAKLRTAFFFLLGSQRCSPPCAPHL